MFKKIKIDGILDVKYEYGHSFLRVFHQNIKYGNFFFKKAQLQLEISPRKGYSIVVAVIGKALSGSLYSKL